MLGHRQLEPSEYLAILKRWRILIATCTITCLVGAVVVTRFIPPRFLSQTLVLIERQKVPDEYVRPVIESNLDGRLASMKEQILSRSRIQPIIERYNLYGSTNGNPAANMDERVDRARAAIGINPIHSTIANAGGLPGFFITFTASDAHTAQLVCGDITTLFTNENLRSRESVTQGTTDFLKSQLTEAKAKLDDQDAKKAAFEREHFGKLPGEEPGNVGMMTSLNAQLEATTQAIASMEQGKSIQESILAQQQQAAAERASVAAASLNPVTGAVLQNPAAIARQSDLKALQDREALLLTQYTASYPDVVAVHRQIQDIKREIAADEVPAPGARQRPAAPSPVETPAIQQLRAQLRAADIGIQEKKRQQAAIQAHLGMYEERIQSSPQVEAEFKELTRDDGTAQEFYNNLLGKINQSKMATDLEKRQEGEQFRVMDEPNLPDSPSFPKLPIFAGGGLLLGLALGLLITAFLEYKDTTLRSERDVWAFTKLPTLGVISVTGHIPELETSPPGFFGRGFASARKVFLLLKRKPKVAKDSLVDSHV